MGKHADSSARKRARAKMKDVANAAGVSIGTVDRVLNKRGRVANETISRVEAVARDLNFAPNRTASSLSRARTHVFVAVLPMPEQDGGYWNLIVQGMERAIEELDYVEVEFLFYDRFDPASFERLATGLTHQQPDGVILAPSIESPARSLVEQVDPRMVVLIDGDLPDSGVLTTISQDSIESGLLAGKLLDLLCPEGRRLLSVTVGVDDHHLQLRRKGFERYFAAIADAGRPQRPLEHLVIADSRDWVRLDSWFAVQGASGHAGAGRDRVIEGVFVTNAAAHEVVARLPDELVPRIVGYDLIPENARALQEGKIDFIINQQPENQGYQALLAIHRARVLGEPVADVIRMPIDIVMRENLDFHPLSTG